MVYPIIFVITDWLQPLVGSILACDLEGKVGKPTVGGCSVPVLHVGRNMDDRAWKDLLYRFPRFLIPTSASHTDKHLSAAFSGTVDVPIVAATGFEGDVGNGNLLA